MRWRESSLLFLLFPLASTALAQSPPGDGVTRFGKVDVERIRPEDLPTKDLTRRAHVAIQRPSRLPSPPSRKDLQALSKRLETAVVTITASHIPPKPFRPTPMIYEGHAVWVRPTPTSTPVLLTTADWLQKAQEIYLTPTTHQDTSRGVPLSALQPARRVADFQRKKARLPRLTIARRDPWRNLVLLATPDTITPPDTALPLFEAETTPLSYTYGYSPALRPSMVATTVTPTPADDPVAAFYYQTPFPATLGAPLVSERGELVMLAAFRSTQNPKLTLAVPPSPILDFLRPAKKP